MVVATDAGVETIRLPPAPPGEILAQGIAADGDTLTATATDFGSDPPSPVTWSSQDGGLTWTLGSNEPD